MADISVTGGSVIIGETGVQDHGIAGASITRGQTLYKDSSDSDKLKAAITTTAATAACVGIALNQASSGQPLAYCRAGAINPGGTVAVGTVYIVSLNAGGIAPITDVLTGQFVTVIGVGTATNTIDVSLHASGVAKA